MSRERDIHEFVAASNLIEGIKREPYPQEIEMVEAFLNLPEITMADVKNAVNVFEPEEVIRDKYGLNISPWGAHVSPSGGPMIPALLGVILHQVNALDDIHRVHCDFEHLHPFTDGNGRVGRLIWLWMMIKRDGWPLLGRSFLHEFYYQTMERHQYKWNYSGFV